MCWKRKKNEAVWVLVALAVVVTAFAAPANNNNNNNNNNDDDDDEGGATTHPRRAHDFCIWGAGAGGMSLAVFLKDRGYDDILVMDRAPIAGGSCNTLRYPGGWNDVGVQIYPDTAFANGLGFGPWDVDMVSLVKRFAGDDAVIPNYYTDLPFFLGSLATDGPCFPIGPPPPPTPEFLAQLGRFLALMNTTYRWMDTLDAVPDPIPLELTLPMSEWIVANGFELLTPSIFVPPLTLAGYGRLDNITAFDGLMQRTSTDMLYVTDSARWFSVRDGCQSIYEGMAAYLGADALLLNATVASIRRPECRCPHRPIEVRGFAEGSGAFVARCKRLVVAIPPTPANLAPLDVTRAESALFGSVSWRQYFTGRFDGVGGTLGDAGTGVALANADFADPYGVPAFPAQLNFIRQFGAGPFGGQTYSDGPLAPARVLTEIFEPALRAAVACGLFDAAGNVSVIPHEFNPHWPAEKMRDPVAPFNQLDALQGERNTWWVGAQRYTANTMGIWNYNLRLARGFPKCKRHHRSGGGGGGGVMHRHRHAPPAGLGL
jgi:hypothetical protein